MGEAYTRRGHSHGVIGDFQQALDHYTHALQLAGNDENISAKGRILSIQAMLFTKLGDQNSANAVADQAMRCAEILADGEERAMILTNVSSYYSSIGNLYESTLLIEQILAATRRIGNKYGESINLGNLGYNYLLIGKFRMGRAYIENALSLSNQIGAQSIYHRLNLIIALLRLRLYDEAMQSKIRLDEVLKWSKDNFAQSIIHTYSGLIYEKMGDFKTSLGEFSQSEKKLLKIQLSSYARDAQAGKVRCLLAQSDFDEASREARILLNNLLQWGTAGMEFPYLAYLTCVDTFQRVGDRESLLKALRTGYEELMHRAARIGNDDWRASFLGNIPENAAMIASWEKVFGTT